MHLHLVLPGLLWPANSLDKPAAGLALPAFAALLGHASVDWPPGFGLERWLATQFGLNTAHPPYALLRRRGEDAAMPQGGHWLNVDPVHLHFARDKLLLAAGTELAITQEEADTLIAGLNETFADIGHFEAAAPERWYLHTPREIRPRFHPLFDVAGRPVELFLPEGEDIARWALLANELQVWLYNHPLSTAREAAGRPAINSSWLWGGGDPLALSSPAPVVSADLPLARGLARSAGIEPARCARFAELDGAADGFVVSAALERPALTHDADAWRAALLTLEADWFVPLLKALKARRIAHLRLSAPGERQSLELAIAAGGMWKFWRQPRPLAALLAAAPTPSPSAAP